MKKDVKKLVDRYRKFIGGGVKVQKTPGNPSTNLSKSELEKLKDMDKYRSFLGQIIWYTMKVGPDAVNTAR